VSVTRFPFSVVAVLWLVALPLRAQGDSLTVRVNAAVKQYERGERDAANRVFQTFIDIYNSQSDRLTSTELAAVAVAVTYLGVSDPQLFKDALKAYDRAIAADPNNLAARTALGELFIEKYNGEEAKRTLTDALRLSGTYVPALVAEARRRDFDNQPGADSVLQRALTLDSLNVAARVLSARFRADVEDFAGARREVDRALRVNPQDAEALAFSAALYRVASDSAGYGDARRRFAALYPREAGVQVATSNLLARVRQYSMAAAVAREGAQLDSTNWKAHAALGSNLLRMGDVPAARRSLEIAFKGDPYDVWTKNTLDLLDTFGEYDEVASERFKFVIEKAESQVLALYLKELMDRAYTTFQKRYAWAPSVPVRVEVYRSHADFSVRTVGLAGLGALGVSFGNTIAFDSPAAKDAGPFNWGSTAWHELAHTFTLGASDHRVPRWLSEGLSVFEERRARAGWGQNVSPAFLKAYDEKKLVPASRMNDGFIRPTFPQHVILSYYQASLVCEMIARDFGEAAIPQMLQAYRSGASNDQVISRVLKLDAAAFDKKFDAYLRERFGKAMAAVRDRDASVEPYMPADELVARANAKPDNYWLQVAVGRVLIQRNEHARAVVVLDRARALFPEYGGPDGAYSVLARAQQSSGDPKAAATTLQAMSGLGDMPYEIHLQLSNLWLQQGDTAKAADALENAMFMNPFDIAKHEQLADLFARTDKRRAVRERMAVVALRPVDLAEAQFKLAVAYRDAGDRVNAKKTVLRALEEAPHFERAQELLLQLAETRP
jgi:tetratricopeptide (TPR) repeat protein